MGEAAKKDDEKEEKLIPVGPGADEVPEVTEEKDEEREDSRLAQTDDDSEDDDKPRKKESSKERRERARKAHQRDRQELEYWRKRGEVLEKRFMEIETRQAQTETGAIDSRITTISAQIATAGRVMADALKKPNGTGAEEFEEAQKIRDELRDQLAELKASKKVHESHTQERVQRAQAAPTREAPDTARPDPRVVSNAREWAAQHKWFSFDGEDEDSRIVRAVDEALAADGFDPTEEDYWSELTTRVKRRLPERFKKDARARPEDDDVDDDDDKPVRTSGPKFSSGGRERPLRKGEVYVSAERKAAMMEYGVWNDKPARDRMLKKYAQWDAEHAATKR